MVGGPKKGWEKRPAAAGGGGFLTWKISFFLGGFGWICYAANIPSVSISFFGIVLSWEYSYAELILSELGPLPMVSWFRLVVYHLRHICYICRGLNSNCFLYNRGDGHQANSRVYIPNSRLCISNIRTPY